MKISLVKRDVYDRWMSSAEEMLRLAENDRIKSFYVWSYYKSRRAAEYALKGLLRGMGIYGCNEPYLLQLITRAGKEGIEFSLKLKEYARNLDKYYISPEEGKYFESEDDQFVEAETAEQAVSWAEEIVVFIKEICS
ncbi:MAG: HEPN domain-containing protein [Clostridia bacterium]|nr:HEPN domain-containing protein [Clostridia bacterium]